MGLVLSVKRDERIAANSPQWKRAKECCVWMGRDLYEPENHALLRKYGFFAGHDPYEPTTAQEFGQGLLEVVELYLDDREREIESFLEFAFETGREEEEEETLREEFDRKNPIPIFDDMPVTAFLTEMGLEMINWGDLSLEAEW